MNNCIKIPINKAYFYSFFILIAGLFLSDTCYLLFGKPTARDITPMVTFDVFYLIVIILFIRKYALLSPNNLTALELTENEIIDYISNVSVKWPDVSDIQFKKTGGSSYISVIVNDKKEVIRQNKNIFRRFSLYVIMLISGSPIRILPIYIKGKNAVIFDRIYKYFQERKSDANIR
jgi:hypothetical protein